MNAKKIAFIICVNDETYYEECLFYIERLHVPEGFQLEVFPMRQAGSIYQAYNQAMQQSDAEYKIYLHQDVFLIYPDMLKELLKFFETHPKAGMAGVLGCSKLPRDRRFYRAWDKGNVLGCSEKKAFHNDLDRETSQAAALDGMLLMTRQDIPWREDALEGWDFYDISQSLEFQRRGYEVWVLGQKEPWCIHDCGYLSLASYDRGQKSFLQLYKDILPDYSKQPEVYPQAYRQKFVWMMELKEQWKALLFFGRVKEIRQMLEQMTDERFYDTETAVLKNILEILQEESESRIEKEQGFLYDCGSFSQAYRKYLRVKFYLRRRKYAPDDTGKCPEISDAARAVIARHTMMPDESFANI